MTYGVQSSCGGRGREETGLAELQTMRDRDLPFTGSLPRWPQQPALSQAEEEAWEVCKQIKMQHKKLVN